MLTTLECTQYFQEGTELQWPEYILNAPVHIVHWAALHFVERKFLHSFYPISLLKFFSVCAHRQKKYYQSRTRGFGGFVFQNKQYTRAKVGNGSVGICPASMRQWPRSASLLISGCARSSLSVWQLLQAGRAQLLASVLTKPRFPSGQLWQLHLNTRTFLLSLFHNSITKGAQSQRCLIISGKARGKGRDESILSPYYLFF